MNKQPSHGHKKYEIKEDMVYISFNLKWVLFGV